MNVRRKLSSEANPVSTLAAEAGEGQDPAKTSCSWRDAPECVVSGCRVTKSSGDCSWSVALGIPTKTGGKRLWFVKVGGKTGRMAVGVAFENCDEVLRAPAGWVGSACDGKVWYYTSAGSLRAGSKVVAETGHRFGEGDTIAIEVDPERGELRTARTTTEGGGGGRGMEELPVVSGLGSTEASTTAAGDSNAELENSKLVLAVAMFFEGAWCEVTELDHASVSWPAALASLRPPPIPAPPPFLRTADVAPAGGPPSVPRLSLTAVGEAGPVMVGSARGGSSVGGSVSDRSAASKESGTERLPSPDPSGPLSSRSGGYAGPGRDLLGPGHVLGGAGRLGLSKTPRGHLGASPQLTPRTSPGVTPRIQASPRGLLSPRAQGGAFAGSSPRYVSPRTPRGMLQSSPRRPEAVTATLSLAQHQQLEAHVKRAGQLEHQLCLAVADTRRLHDQLQALRGAHEQANALNVEEGDEEEEDEETGLETEAAEEEEEEEEEEAQTEAVGLQEEQPAGAGEKTEEEEQEQERALGMASLWELDPADVERVRPIGSGACGTVWEGRYKRAPVAVKELAEGAASPELLRAFRCEVEQLSRLRHPNVVAFYGAVTQGAGAGRVVVTELLSRDLRSFLRSNAPAAPLRHRLRLAQHALRGLVYLHALTPPVIHRDVKPENLLLGPQDLPVKLCDLGLARGLGAAGGRVMTRHGQGTAWYMSPEMHQGLPLGPACDVYAVAVVLWELATLRTPYSDKPPQSIPGIVGWGRERPDTQPLDDLADTSVRAPLNEFGVGAGSVEEGGVAWAGLRGEAGGQEGSAEGAVYKALKSLLQEAWAQEADERLTAAALHERLSSLILSLEASSERPGGAELVRSESAGGRAESKERKPRRRGVSEEGGARREDSAEKTLSATVKGGEI